MDFCSECGSMILNGSKCPMCGCIKTAETKEVKKTPQPEKKKRGCDAKFLVVFCVFNFLIIFSYFSCFLCLFRCIFFLGCVRLCIV